MLWKTGYLTKPLLTSDRNQSLHGVVVFQGILLNFKFYPNWFSGFWNLGVENCSFSLFWPSAYATAYTTVLTILCYISSEGWIFHLSKKWSSTPFQCGCFKRVLFEIYDWTYVDHVLICVQASTVDSSLLVPRFAMQTEQFPSECKALVFFLLCLLFDKWL